MPTTAEKRATFRALHEDGCFVLPNPWDRGTARYLESLGFRAQATTSAGFAFSQARPDNGVTLEAILRHIAEIVDATDLPVNADFENGFADDPAGVAENVKACIETGVAGLSIEDSRQGGTDRLYPLDLAVERVKAARKAVDAADGRVILTARAECFFVGVPDLEEATTRLRAYSEAGADCLYAPGIRTREQIEAVVAAVAPKPVNLLVGWPSEYSVGDLAAMGVRRISTGGGLALAAWGGFQRAAKSLIDDGSFAPFAENARSPELNAFFRGE
ncbi:MAG: isocitrate lyase/phosphoenolpyruvate mutase family protein [Dehalococcoidia bacterium]|nr:isocitrate lyase/phosphoenolpyruvate mutase family protein [Dehalococcoidia bacterium]